MRTTAKWTCVALLLGAAGTASAQNQLPPRPGADVDVDVQVDERRSDERRGEERRGEERRGEERRGEDRAADAGQLSDAGLESWLQAEHRKIADISRYAARRSQDAQVADFAAHMAQAHNQLAAGGQRDRAAEATAQHGAAPEGGSLQLGALLREVGEELRRDPALRDRIGSRADQEPRQEVREQRQEVREERREVRNRPAVNDGAREQVRDERTELREQRRERLRRWVEEGAPAVRDNLPEILEVLGQTIDDSSAGSDAAWVQFHQQVAARQTESIKQELARQDQREFDEAYLSWVLASHLKLIDTLHVARQQASPEMSQQLDQSLAEVEDHLQKAKAFMKQHAGAYGRER